MQVCRIAQFGQLLPQLCVLDTTMKVDGLSTRHYFGLPPA